MKKNDGPMITQETDNLLNIIKPMIKNLSIKEINFILNINLNSI